MKRHASLQTKEPAKPLAKMWLAVAGSFAVVFTVWIIQFKITLGAAKTADNQNSNSVLDNLKSGIGDIKAIIENPLPEIFPVASTGPSTEDDLEKELRRKTAENFKTELQKIAPEIK